jgi:chitinase
MFRNNSLKTVTLFTFIIVVGVLVFGVSQALAYPAWDGNSHPYIVGDLVTYNGRDYRCQQAHTSQPDWNPVATPALWVDLGPTGSGPTPTRTNTVSGPTPTRTNTPTGPTPTRTNTAIGPTPTRTNTSVAPTPTRTNTAVGPTPTPCASCGLPKRVMVGYWHNFDNGSGFIRLRNVSTKWDVIIVAFGEPTTPTSGTIVFTPYNSTVADFQSDVAYLKSIGKKVLISIGGANGTVQLTTTTARTNFVNSVTSIINTYGFNGLDIDFEGQSLIVNQGDTDFTAPTTPVIVNTISAIRSVRNNFGSSFILTMAPETFFVQLGYQFYGGTCLSCDRRAGAFLPVIYGTRDILTWLQVQDYNSGPIMGLDNNFYSMGSPDFHSAMLDMTLTNFVVAGTGKTFPALRPDQVALGIPASVNAGNGYMTPTEVQKALNYIIKGQSYGEHTSNGIPFPRRTIYGV